MNSRKKKPIGWCVRGGGVHILTPYKSQWEAWEAMRLTDKEAARQGVPYPPDTFVYPVFEEAP
jgi:hypothetical protein